MKVYEWNEILYIHSINRLDFISLKTVKAFIDWASAFYFCLIPLNITMSLFTILHIQFLDFLIMRL